MAIEIIDPKIRDASELKYHTDDGPGYRMVFLDEKSGINPEFYVIGRRADNIPKNQPEYVSPHRHSNNSYYIFIGDGSKLEGLEARIDIEGQSREVLSPCSVVIPENSLHHYKLTRGKGWFFHINMNPNYNASLTEKVRSEDIPLDSLIAKAQFRQTKPDDRPITSDDDVIANPQRWIFIGPKIFNDAGIYAALHVIRDDLPYQYSMKQHHHC